MSKYSTKHTEVCSTKTDGKLITKTYFEIFTSTPALSSTALEDTGMLAKSNITYVNNEITKPFLEDLIHLYVKTKTFSEHAQGKLVTHKLLLLKNKTRSLEQQSKNHAKLLQAHKDTLKVWTIFKTSKKLYEVMFFNI